MTDGSTDLGRKIDICHYEITGCVRIHLLLGALMYQNLKLRQLSQWNTKKTKNNNFKKTSILVKNNNLNSF